MEDKSKMQKGVGQIKEGMGKISEGVGNIVETKVDPKPDEAKPLSHKPFITAEEALNEQRRQDAAKAANPEPKAASFTPAWRKPPEPGMADPKPLNPVGARLGPAAFPGATPDAVEPNPGKAFTGFPAKPNVITPPVDPMIEQARRVEAAHPVIMAPGQRVQTQEEIEADRKDLALRQTPKQPGPATTSRPKWEEDDIDKERPKATASFVKPLVPGTVAMPANAPQEWRRATMPAPEPPMATDPAVVPDPKPVPLAPNVKKGNGITYIGKYKKFHAEFKSSGQIYNVGFFDTEALAVEGIAKAKAHLNP